MTRLGADPSQLRTLAAELDLAAKRLDATTSGVSTRLRAANWHGADAERFERTWNRRDRPALRAQSHELATLATSVRRNADEQERASLSGSVAPAGSGLAPAALRTEVYSLDASGSVRVLQLAAGTDLMVEHLDGGHARVTLTQEGRVAATASASRGTSMWFGDLERTDGASIGGSVGLTATTSQTWTTSEAELPSLFAAIAGSSLASGPASLLNAATSGLNTALDAVGDYLGIGDISDIPSVSIGASPDQSTNLVGIELAGAGWAGWAGSAFGLSALGARASAGGSAVETVKVGLTDGKDGRAFVVEGQVDGEMRAAAGLTGAGGTGRDASVSSQIRLVVPLDGADMDRTRSVQVEVRTHIPDQPAGEVEVLRVALAPDAATDAVAPALNAARLLGHGDVAGAGAALAALPQTLTFGMLNAQAIDASIEQVTSTTPVGFDVGIAAVSGKAVHSEHRA